MIRYDMRFDVANKIISKLIKAYPKHDVYLDTAHNKISQLLTDALTIYVVNPISFQENFPPANKFPINYADYVIAVKGTSIEIVKCRSSYNELFTNIIGA